MTYFLTYHTTDEYYYSCAQRLKASLRRFGLEYRSISMPSCGSWLDNEIRKPTLIREVLLERKGSVVWLDADSEVVSLPNFQPWLYTCDIAAYRQKLTGGRWSPTRPFETIAAVLMVSYTKAAIDLLDKWIELTKTPREKWTNEHNFTGDQAFLDDALSQSPAVFGKLPQGYCKIFDAQWRDGEVDTPVIIQHQASRVMRNQQR